MLALHDPNERLNGLGRLRMLRPLSVCFSSYQISTTDASAHHRHISVDEVSWEYALENWLEINLCLLPSWNLSLGKQNYNEGFNANCGGPGWLQAALGAHSGCFKVRTSKTLGVQHTLQTLGIQTYLADQCSGRF